MTWSDNDIFRKLLGWLGKYGKTDIQLSQMQSAILLLWQMEQYNNNGNNSIEVRQMIQQTPGLRC